MQSTHLVNSHNNSQYHALALALCLHKLILTTPYSTTMQNPLMKIACMKEFWGQPMQSLGTDIQIKQCIKCCYTLLHAHHAFQPDTCDFSMWDWPYSLGWTPATSVREICHIDKSGPDYCDFSIWDLPCRQQSGIIELQIPSNFPWL